MEDSIAPAARKKTATIFSTGARVIALAVFVYALGLGLTWFISREDPTLASRQNYGRGGPPEPSTPSLSPDGAHLVCDAFGDVNGRVFRVSRDGSTVQRLTASNSLERSPVYSPNGGAIAFTREGDGYEHVWLMDANGSNATPLTAGRVLDDVDCFSSDGARVFFLRAGWAGRFLQPRVEMFVAEAQGPQRGNAQRIGTALAVSHDEKSLLFAVETRTGSQEIWLTNRVSRATQLIGQGNSASFSVDDQKIVFLVRDKNYLDDLMVWDISQAKAVKVPSPLGQKSRPVFCLKDTSIIFRMENSERDGPGGIYILRLQDHHLERIRIN